MLAKCSAAVMAGLWLFFSQPVFAQDPGNFSKTVDFLPPPPNVTAMFKHDQIAINKNTGAPNLNIPIYNIKGHKLSVNVGIGYNSYGIKVDEIASQVGMGWSLQAGGMISRTIRGQADELNTRINAPSTGINPDPASYSFVSNIGNTVTSSGGFDSEPDLFNFSFGQYSGSFVFDTAMKILMINASPVKITCNFNGTSWNFMIVDPEGIIYYFGGAGATEKTKADQTCGKVYSSYVPTVWHLNQIQHPNGESIFFNYIATEYVYDVGQAQTQNFGSQSSPTGSSCNTFVCTYPVNLNCEHLLRTQGVLLDNIFLPGNSRLTFSYIDRQDYLYGKLLSRIRLYDLVNNANSLVDFWDFSYNQQLANTTYQHRSESWISYTSYLTSAVHKSGDSTITLPYYFVYNDPASRPTRLSYAQDHWGYFNGRNNSTLIPTPTDPQQIPWFPQATANRTPDFNYMVKGMLSKIVYPTGGMDSLVYESNTISGQTSDSYAPLHRMTGTITGAGFDTQGLVNYTVATDKPQSLNLSMNCVDNSGTGDFDPLHNKCKLELFDPTGMSVWNHILQPGQSWQEYVPVMTGNYNLRLTANGSVATLTITQLFYPVHGSTVHTTNSATAGLRVRSLLTANPGEKATVKRFYYGELNSLDVSSIDGVDVPVYSKALSMRVACSLTYGGCPYTSLYSSTLGNLFDFQSVPVSYASVVESQGGDNFEKGGIQTHFFTRSDAIGQVLYGDLITGANKSNFSSYVNGKIREEYNFMKPDGQTIVPLTRKIYTYKIDSRVGRVISGYPVHQAQTVDHLPDPNSPGQVSDYLAAFDVMRYDIAGSWVYNDTLSEYVYSLNTTMSKMTRNYYNDTTNLMLSRTESNDSKNNLMVTVYKYPHDYVGQPVYDSMIARHIIKPAVDLEKDRGATRISQAHTNFANWGNGNFDPSYFQTAFGSGLSKDVGDITKYDRTGNILEYKGEDGVLTSVIWGFNNLYPVAKIAGIGYDQARAQLGVDTSQINILSGTGLLNQLNVLRTNLSTAQVTTYDFKPQTGVLSIRDINNRAAYYDYDSFRRLIDSKDKDGNIVKQVNYHYVTADPNATFTIYVNQSRTVVKAPTSCLAGYTSGSVAYVVPAGKYFSTISVADANAKADAEANLYAQDNANKNAFCTLDNPIVF